jgi:predicted nicotinamide N-methyase
LADVASGVNAGLNGVAVRLGGDVVGQDCRWDVIVTGDVCYEAATAGHIMPWLRRMAGSAEVWMADPGRAYLPREGMAAFADYVVPTTRELEDRDERRVVLYRVLP